MLLRMDRIGPKRVLKWYHREWRKKLDLSQDQLANRANTTKGQISKLETGRQRMNDDWVLILSEALGIEPHDLMRDPDAPTMNDLLRGVEPAERERVTAVVKLLLAG